MKKVMFGLACAAAVIAVADIESSNIVGYTTIDITKSYSILAINFETTASGEIAINDAFPKCEGMTAGGAITAADSIQVMQDDGTYVNYYLSNGKSGKASYPATENKWVKAGAVTVPTTDTLKYGKAFWYVSRAFDADPSAKPYSVQISGQVLAASESSKEVAQNYMLIGNPYPVEIPLNDGVQITKGLTTGGAITAADSLQIMQDDGSYVNYYMSNGKSGKASYPETENKWVKAGAVTVPTTDKFPVGKGAWLVSRTGDTTIKFVK